MHRLVKLGFGVQILQQFASGSSLRLPVLLQVYRQYTMTFNRTLGTSGAQASALTKASKVSLEAAKLVLTQACQAQTLAAQRLGECRNQSFTPPRHLPHSCNLFLCTRNPEISLCRYRLTVHTAATIACCHNCCDCRS